MSLRPQSDMLRTQHIQQPNSFNINPPSFLNQSQPGQPQSQPPHIPNIPPNPNPPVMNGMMNPRPGPNYHLQMQQVQAMQRPYMTGPQGMNPVMGGPSNHVNGLPTQLSGMNFSNPMMAQNQRRGPPQQGLNQNTALGGGMHAGQMMPGMAGMNPMAGMGMRQVPQQPPMGGMRMNSQGQMGAAAALGTDLQIAGLNRAPGMVNGPNYAQHMARTPSGNQSMPGIPQPPTLPQTHPNGMQQQHFAGGMGMPQAMHGQQNQPIGSSPHPPQPGQQGAMPNNMAGPSMPPGAAMAGNRRMATPDQMLFNFPNNQMQGNLPHNAPRMPTAGSQLNFGGSAATPPNHQLHEMSQGIPTGRAGTPRSASRQSSIMATPAQALDAMSNETFSSPFAMHPQASSAPAAAPPRPPSQQRISQPFPAQQPQQPPQPPLGAHRSPRQPNHIAHQMPRPQSQPQIPQGQSPKQAGSTRTPRITQPQLPPQLPPSGMMPNRTPSLAPAQPQPQPPAPPPKPPTPAAANPQQMPAQSRPPQGPPTISSQQPHVGVNQAGSQPPPGVVPPEPAPAIPQLLSSVRNNTNTNGPVGSGQALLRLMQFSGVLAGEGRPAPQQKLQLGYWQELINEYFTPKAVLKFTLWKDNQRNEAKPFEIGVPILPRFFLVTSQSGVKNMTLSLDGARERTITTGHAVVECISAVWTYKYHNGYTVTLRGPMTCHVVVTLKDTPGQNPLLAQSYSLKFDQLQFDANYHDKLISLDAIMNPESPVMSGLSPLQQQQPPPDDRHYDEPRYIIEHASIPAEPVNAFGIPQATMRCLELAESVTQMSDLIRFSTDKNLGPKEALAAFAKQLREMHPQPVGPAAINGIHGGAGVPGPPGPSTNGHMPEQHMNGLPTSSALYAGSQHPSASLPHSAPTPTAQQNGPVNMDGTPKLSKAVTQTQPQPSGSTPSGSTPAASTPTAGSMTPSTAPATLKRKATDSASPVTTNSEQQPQGKRARGKQRRATNNTAG